MNRAQELTLREDLRAARFAATAAAVLHAAIDTNAVGRRCAECGQPWPCRTWRVVHHYQPEQT